MSNEQTPLTAQQFLAILYNPQHPDYFTNTWVKIWGQVCAWYGDVNKKENEAEFLSRLNSEYGFPEQTAQLRQEVVGLKKEVEELNNLSNYWEELYKSIT